MLADHKVNDLEHWFLKKKRLFEISVFFKQDSKTETLEIFLKDHRREFQIFWIAEEGDQESYFEDILESFSEEELRMHEG